MKVYMNQKFILIAIFHALLFVGALGIIFFTEDSFDGDFYYWLGEYIFGFAPAMFVLFLSLASERKGTRKIGVILALAYVVGIYFLVYSSSVDLSNDVQVNFK